MEEVRGLHLDALDETLDDLSDDLSARSKKAIAAIKRSGYKRSVILRETDAITRNTNELAARNVAESIRDASFFADRSQEIIRAWTLAGRIQDLPLGSTVTNAQIERARAFSSRVLVADAEAAFAREKRARLRTSAQQREAFAKYGARSGYQPTYAKTEGVEILLADRKAGNIKSSREIGLSRRLHGSAADNTRSTRKAMTRMIREGRDLDSAGRELIRELRRVGPNESLGQRQRLTKALRKMQRAGRRLAELGDGDKPAARREWRKQLDAIRRQAARLADKRGAYAEFIQKLEGTRPRIGKVQARTLTPEQLARKWDAARAKATDKALGRWLDEKQRYNAERIVETETNAAYRAREYEQAQPYITHFIWHLNRGARKAYVRRTKPRPIRRKGKKGGRKARRCVCESFDGQKFPIEVAKDYPRGGHPWCRCWYEYIYNTGKASRARVSDEDLAWFEGLPD
ncbi:MAG: hypothetical protein ACYTEQ_19705 [Planctomycetota bacterium]|jgi:hypothetical protein